MNHKFNANAANMPKEIRGRLPVIRVVAMPSDENPDGDIFGGWLLSQMDLAAGDTARDVAKGRVVTIAVEAMKFHKPVYTGDVMAIYTQVIRTGKTSVTVKVESWAVRRKDQSYVKVTEGEFTFVHIDKDRKPILLPQPNPL